MRDMHLYTDNATEALKFQMTCPSQWVSWSPLGGKGGRGSGLAWTSPFPWPVRLSAPSLHCPMAAAEHWKGNSSFDSQAQTQSSQASTLPQTNMCFCGKTTQSQDPYAASRSGLHWPCSPSQIIEPRPHSAGRNLEIIFAGASEPPGQLMKAQIPGLQSQDSDSVGLGWPCRSDFLVNFQSMWVLPIQAPHVSNAGLW